jgi:opacity protein-like surface antigen
MKKTLMVLGMTFTMMTSAHAQDTSFKASPYAEIGGGVSNNTKNGNFLNLAMGDQIHQNVRVELDADTNFRPNGVSEMLTTNLILQQKLPTTVPVTPYLLAGVGYDFGKSAQMNTGNDAAVYTIGAGTTVGLTQNVDFDIRYRNVRPFTEALHTAVTNDNIFTAGLRYHF